jgi:hypothetical protein
MVNAGRTGGCLRIRYCFVILYADIAQTLHSCYGHIEDVHATFWKRFRQFSKNLHVVEFSHFSTMFQINDAYFV